MPCYQPKIDLQSGAIVGFEALMRWEDEHKCFQPPETIAEAFKDYDLASKLGELMQNRVFADMRKWIDLGANFGRVSINAAPVEFLRDDFAERLLERLAEQDLTSTRLEIEVTEHVFLERGTDCVGRALDVLHQAEAKVSLDDFGTGYSSLSHLRDFAVDVVKLDRSFIARLIEELDIEAIVSAVIDLAKSLSLEVVAEGVETYS